MLVNTGPGHFKVARGDLATGKTLPLLTALQHLYWGLNYGRHFWTKCKIVVCRHFISISLG